MCKVDKCPPRKVKKKRKKKEHWNWIATTLKKYANFIKLLYIIEFCCEEWHQIKLCVYRWILFTLVEARPLISKSHHHTESNPLVQYRWFGLLNHMSSQASNLQAGLSEPRSTSHQIQLLPQIWIEVLLLELCLCPILLHDSCSWNPNLKNQPKEI